jgi:hypothetical protein
MRFAVAAIALLLFPSGFVRAVEEPKLLTRVTPLPVALDPEFQFRKTKIFAMPEKPPKQKGTKGGQQASTASKSSSVLQEASITFERQYRLFGAITRLDQHQRFGDYFDFFWRAKRPANLTVRLEYRQEKLHAHVQAQEISYANVHGNHKTEFKVIGDDYSDDGRVIAWRCLVIESGRIVAETHSFLWD